MEKLKPCLFCGKIPVLSTFGCIGYVVSCGNQHCEEFFNKDRFDTPKEAIKAWNEREYIYNECR